MTARPGSFPDFAKTARTDPGSGEPNIVTPDGTHQSYGFVYTEKPAFQHFNWLFKWIGSWLHYLDEQRSLMWSSLYLDSYGTYPGVTGAADALCATVYAATIGLKAKSDTMWAALYSTVYGAYTGALAAVTGLLTRVGVLEESTSVLTGTFPTGGIAFQIDLPTGFDKTNTILIGMRISSTSVGCFLYPSSDTIANIGSITITGSTNKLAVSPLTNAYDGRTYHIMLKKLFVL